MSPRTPTEFVVLGFESTHDALAAEDLIKRAGIPVVPIPAPPTLSALCGIAMRLEPSHVIDAERVLDEGGIRPCARTRILDV